MSTLQIELMEMIEGLSDDTLRMLFRSNKAVCPSIGS